jgi:hypothetical protein
VPEGRIKVLLGREVGGRALGVVSGSEACAGLDGAADRVRISGNAVEGLVTGIARDETQWHCMEGEQRE